MRTRTATALFATIALAVTSALAARQEPTERPAVRPAAQPVRSPADEQLPPRERPRPRDEKALFELFAASPGFEAQYEEEKHLALLAVPLHSRGTLYFLPPGHLARHVTDPEPSSVLITPTEMRTTARGKEKRVDLAQAGELRAFVTSLSQVLAGRREGLATLWSIAYASSADDLRAWTLTLVPRADTEGHEALTRMVSSLTLVGEGEFVVRIEVREPNGDRTITRIVRADPQRVFDDDERARWFGLPPAAEAEKPAKPAADGPPR